VARDEAEAAYFTLLRARDEVTRLQRYADYLLAEAQRLRRAAAEGAALTTAVEAPVRRALAASDAAMADVAGTRLALLEDEAARLPDRLAAAEAFVVECERTLADVRREPGSAAGG
jgi:hypothetical protein